MIESIDIKIGEEIVKLSMEEAKELKRELEVLFSAPVFFPYTPPAYVPYPTLPVPPLPFVTYTTNGTGNSARLC